MKEKQKKFLLVLTLVTTLILSIFAVVVTQYDIKFVDAAGVDDDGPIVKIFTDSSEGTVPFVVNFSSIVTNCEGDVKYEWDFGNGNTSEERQPKVLYLKEMEYTCTLKVTDDKDKTKTDSIKIMAKRNKPPVVTLSINQKTIERKYKWLSTVDKIPFVNIFLGYAGNRQELLNSIEESKGVNAWGEGRIICTAQVDDPEDDEIVSYEWIEQTAESTVTKGGEVIHPKHEFTDNKSITIPEIYTWMEGRHIVTLKVTDSAGNTANASVDFQVEKSMEKVNREAKLRNAKNLLNAWINYGNPFIGPIVTGLLLAGWKYNNLTGIKIVVLVLSTYVLQLDTQDELITQAKTFINEHPRLKDSFKEVLLNQKEKLEQKLVDETDPDKKEALEEKIETIQRILEDFGMTNLRPGISSPYPLNNAEYIDRNYPCVYVNVTDAEGDLFDVHIYGDYVNDITLINQSSGIFNATLITPLPGQTGIVWNVEVTDKMDRSVEKSYKFTTFWE